MMLHKGLIQERKHGPSILWQVEALWTNKDSSIGSLEGDVELKREARPNTVQIVNDVLANTETSLKLDQVETYCWVWVTVKEKIASIL